MLKIAEDLSQAARSAWAKSIDQDGAWLPLWQHMDDAADVAQRLFDRWLPAKFVRLLADDFGGDIGAARVAVSFLAGMHDLGKATPAFAVQDTVLAQRMRNLGLYMPETKAELPDRHLAHHSVAGHHLLVRWLVDQGWTKSTARTWGVVLGGHHGLPPTAQDELLSRPIENPDLYGIGTWDSVRAELADRVAVRSGANALLSDWRELRLSQQFQVLVTGLVIVSDWIASNANLFPFYADSLPQASSRTARAASAIARLRLPAPWTPHSESISAKDLFERRFDLPPGATPRPVQEATLDVARRLTEPGIMVIEAPMGEGKTEAALAAAEVMASCTGAGGLLVALPTQATTDAMFERVLDWLDRMAVDGKVDGSIMLSHGKARFNELFQGLVSLAGVREVGRDEPGDIQSPPTTRHAVTAHSWLIGRKKRQLANFTIGTIDQLLFAALKARHLMLRHVGLAGKVVIIDEVHAYDAYMNSYLTRVLTWLGAYRVPVIALSATLPPDRRCELIEAYVSGRAQTIGADQAFSAASDNGGYPVITWTDQNVMRLQVAPPSGRGTTVHVDALPDDPEALVAVLTDALSEGGAALVVHNTVRRVLETADVVERAFPGEVSVAHSRFIVADRLQNDTALLDQFGPPGRARMRPYRHVVVASQVVEQSLDIDFDLLVTDLAPVDLVLQRMGRLHRHHRGDGQSARPRKVRTARAFITGTDFSQSPPALEPAAERNVYNAHTLLRSAAVLMPRFGSVIRLPDDIAVLVQAVYGTAELGPPDWQDAMRTAVDRCLAAKARREDKAQSFQIAKPAKPGKPIVGWLAADVGEADDDSQGQGQVRDGAPSLEVILVQADPAGRWHTPTWLSEPNGGRPIPHEEAPPDALAEVIASCAIRLPLEFSNPESEEELWRATPTSWESSPLVYRLPVLLVDDDGCGTLNGRRVRYTATRGLEVADVDE